MGSLCKQQYCIELFHENGDLTSTFDLKELQQITGGVPKDIEVPEDKDVAGHGSNQELDTKGKEEFIGGACAAFEQSSYHQHAMTLHFSDGCRSLSLLFARKQHCNLAMAAFDQFHQRSLRKCSSRKI